MSNLSEIIKKAIEDADCTVYIETFCSKLAFDKATGEKTALEEFPEGVEVLTSVADFESERSTTIIVDEGQQFRLLVFRGIGDNAVYSEVLNKYPERVIEDTFELCPILENDEFLGYGTYVEGTDGDLFGSSMYLRWDGSKYVKRAGSLDSWLMGEQDNEYELTEDGKDIRLKQHIE